MSTNNNPFNFNFSALSMPSTASSSTTSLPDFFSMSAPSSSTYAFSAMSSIPPPPPPNTPVPVMSGISMPPAHHAPVTSSSSSQPRRTYNSKRVREGIEMFWKGSTDDYNKIFKMLTEYHPEFAVLADHTLMNEMRTKIQLSANTQGYGIEAMKKRKEALTRTFNEIAQWREKLMHTVKKCRRLVAFADILRDQVDDDKSIMKDKEQFLVESSRRKVKEMELRQENQLRSLQHKEKLMQLKQKQKSMAYSYGGHAGYIDDEAEEAPEGDDGEENADEMEVDNAEEVDLVDEAMKSMGVA